MPHPEWYWSKLERKLKRLKGNTAATFLSKALSTLSKIVKRSFKSILHTWICERFTWDEPRKPVQHFEWRHSGIKQNLANSSHGTAQILMLIRRAFYSFLKSHISFKNRIKNTEMVRVDIKEARKSNQGQIGTQVPLLKPPNDPPVEFPIYLPYSLHAPLFQPKNWHCENVPY